jgi:type IV secretion/conjugal transfer VirB4 family ATPase
MASGIIGALAGVAASVGIRRFREHRTESRGLADLLQWGFLVDDGIVLQKEGSLLAAWAFHGPDLSGATDAALAALGQHVHDALLAYGSEWVFHVDAIRRPAMPYPISEFPNEAAARIDAERRAAYLSGGERFETAYVLAATYQLPAEIQRRLEAAFLSGSNRRGVDWSFVLDRYRAAIRQLEGRLASSLKLERLDSAALLSHFAECVTGIRRRVNPPAPGAFLDYALVDQPLLGGFTPRIGEQHVRVIVIQGYPATTTPGAMDFLGSLPHAYRWSTRILPLTATQGAAHIRRLQLRWFQKRRGLGAWAKDIAAKQSSNDVTPTAQANEELFQDGDATLMVRDAAEAAAENASGALRYCYITQTVIVTDIDEARAGATAGAILNRCIDEGYGGRIESVNAVEAYIGSLPGHGYHNLRRSLVSTRNAVDMLPLTGVWPGLDHNPSPLFPHNSPPLLWAATTGSTPFRLNLHVGDVGHTLIVGKTGAGKSTLVAMLCAQWQRYAGAQVVLFDVGYSGLPLCKAVGGRHYDIAAGRPDALSFQPLARINEPAERAWATEWVETAIVLQGVRLTPTMRDRIDAALMLVARNEPEYRTLSELLVQLQQPELVAGLKPYTVGGPYGAVLDGKWDKEDRSNYLVFELRSLLDLDDRILVPVLLHLFRRVERLLDGRPTLIVIEELWGALLRSQFATRIRQWLLTLRKQNAAVVLVAHGIEQIQNAPNSAVLWESCPTRIFLPNADAAALATEALYTKMGLGEREIATIVRAKPKAEYYYRSPLGGRLFDLRAAEYALPHLVVHPHRAC